MDEKALLVLKRKLESLQYMDDFDRKSAPLIQRLLDDLVHTTESYRSLKIKSSRGSQDSEELKLQVEVLQKDLQRAVHDNNSLHVDLMSATEAARKFEREAYLSAKKLEDQIAELSFARDAAMQRAKSVEREITGLKIMIQEAAITHPVKTPEGQPPGMPNAAQLAKAKMRPGMQILETLRPNKAARRSVDDDEEADGLEDVVPRAEAEAAVRAAEARLVGLEAEKRRLKESNDALRKQTLELRDQIDARDGEIKRLGGLVEKGRDLERMTLQHKAESAEKRCTALDQQVSYLNRQLEALESQAVPMKEALDKSDAERRLLEGKLRATLQENESMRRELQELQAALEKLRENRRKEESLGMRGKSAAPSGAVTGTQSPRGEGASPRASADLGPAAQVSSALGVLQSERLQAVAALKASEAERQRLEKEIAYLRGELRKATDAVEGTDGADGAAAAAPAPAAAINGNTNTNDSLVSFVQHERAAELEGELAAAVARTRALAADVERLTAEARGSETKWREAERQREALGALTDQLYAEKAALADRLAIAEGSQGQIEATLNVLGSEKGRLEGALRARDARHEDIEAAGEGMRARVLDLERDVSALGRRVTELEAQLRSAEDARDRCSAQLEGLQLQLEEARAARDGAMAAQKEADTRMHVTGRLAEERSMEIHHLRAELAEERRKVAAAREDNQHVRAELKDREETVARLQGLIGQLDATREQLVGRLKLASTEHKDAEARAGRLDLEASAARATLEAREGEIQELRGVLQSVDADRDVLQAKLDAHAEELSALSAKLAATAAENEGLRATLLGAEARVQQLTDAANDLQGQVQALALKSDRQEASLREGAAERTALQEEMRALQEDLASVAKENQVVNHELVRACSERDALSQELRATRTQLEAAEQLVRAKERELGELLVAYRQAGAESQRAASTVAQLERSTSERETELRDARSEAEGLRAALQSLQAENGAMLADVQALEAQVDSLGTRLAKGESERRAVESERDEVRALVSSLKQVQLQLEVQRQTQQRQLAAADGRVHLLQSKVESGAAELQALQHRLALETERVKELESLLADVRAKQHTAQVLVDDRSSTLQLLQDRNLQLEEQGSALRHQLHALQAQRDATQTELERTRLEHQAVQAAAVVIAQDAGSAGGSSYATHAAAVTGSGPAGSTMEAVVADQSAAISALRAELAACYDRIDGLEGALGEAQSKLTGVTAGVEELERVKATAEQRVQAAEARATEVAARLATVQASAAAPLETIKEVSQQVGAARARIVDLEAALAQRETALREAEGRAREAEAQAAQLEGSVRELRKEVAALLARVTDREAELRTALEGVERHRREAERLGGLVDGQAEARAADLERRLEAERQRRKQAERDFKALMEGVTTGTGGGGAVASPAPASRMAVEGGGYSVLAGSESALDRSMGLASEATPAPAPAPHVTSTPEARLTVDEIDAQIRQLREGNMALRTNLRGAQIALGSVSTELERARTSYTTASTGLSSALDRMMTPGSVTSGSSSGSSGLSLGAALLGLATPTSGGSSSRF